MKLKVIQQQQNKHRELVASVGWCGADMFSCGDDGDVWKWDKNGESSQSPLLSVKTSFTDMHWLQARRYTAVTDANTAAFVLACTDGSVKIVTKGGRIEKSIDNAHAGAVTAVKWSADGSIVTAGEDGLVKIWSRAGLARSTLLQTGRCVFAMAWSPSNNELLVASGKDLILKPLQATSKQYQWQAHESPVLKVDWNPVNNLILSGGEDCRYKVWDSYGRLIYQSSPMEHHVTSVAWAPDGDVFAVGSFNTLCLCDRMGWVHSKDRLSCGSVFDLAWTSDGTQLGASGGNGAVVFGYVTERSVEWGGLLATLGENNHVRVTNVQGDVVDEQEFRDRVVRLAMGHGHLVVTTLTQCHLYSTAKWSNPVPLDLKDTINLVQLADKCFLTVDPTAGVQVFNYEGRLICSPKFKGLRPEFLNQQTVSISSNYIAIVDRMDGKAIHVFDVASGRPTGVSLQHNVDIAEIAISQHQSSGDQLLAFIDRNGDLYVTPILKRNIVKLTLMADTIMWHETTGILAAVSCNKLLLWYYPQAAFVDPELLAKSCTTRDPGTEIGLHSRIVGFDSSKCSVRKSDGTLVTVSVPPHPGLLQESVAKGEWAAALKLCRYVKDESLWAALAAMALNLGELNTAQMALSSIEMVDKLRFISHTSKLVSAEVQTSELLAFKRQPTEAEAVLIQAGLFYRAIKLNIHLFKWERALDIAVKYRTHVDTVLGHRQRFLELWGKRETNPKFLKYSDVKVEWDKIKQKAREEKENEKRRAAAAAPQASRS